MKDTEHLEADRESEGSASSQKDNNEKSSTTGLTMPTNIKAQSNETGSGNPSKWKTLLPSFIQGRKVVKASIGLALAMILTICNTMKSELGDGALLVAIVAIFYFPVRTIVVYGTFGALIGSLWCLLGMFLADLARNKADPNPVQPAKSVVLAVFLFFGTFCLNYVRMRFPKANFACVNACILVTLSMTYASITPMFVPDLVWLFMKPIAVAGAASLAVNYLLWPDDSVTNYMMLLKKTLTEYKSFAEENSSAFLSNSFDGLESNLPALQGKLNSSLLMLIDSKRAVQREIIYSRISSIDISAMTKIVKDMRPTLYGIGLSWILKKEYSKNIEELYVESNKSVKLQQFQVSFQSAQSVCQKLLETTQQGLTDCIQSLNHFHRNPRTKRSSFLWPFPRLFYAIFTQSVDQETASLLKKSRERLEEAIRQFDQECKEQSERDQDLYIQAHKKEYDIFYLIFLYQFNLKGYATHVVNLLKHIEENSTAHPKYSFWLPVMTLRKWFKRPKMDELNGGYELTLIRTSTRQDNSDIISKGKPYHKKVVNGKIYTRDADVTPPTTVTERFFYQFQKITNWLFETDTVFSFKTAVGVVLGAIPCYLPWSVAWYIAWRGQWALITLVLWMVPMTGMFNFTLFLKIIGTVMGGIAGIIVWEISQGNPYGIVVVSFIFFLPLYYIFLFTNIYKATALMIKITMILVVVYEYNYVASGVPNYDAVWTIAGKRVLLVLIGIAASYILMVLPYPVIGRVELRKRLAHTIHDVEVLYGILSANLVRSANGKPPTASQIKIFNKISLNIKRQIEDERSFLFLSTFEPPLHGKFPKQEYATILSCVDNMSELVSSMAYCSRNVDSSWTHLFVDGFLQERRQYLSAVITTLKLTSASLATKMPLPPYLVSPMDLRDRYSSILQQEIQGNFLKTSSSAFTCLMSYVMNHHTFVQQTQQLLDSVESLVGTDDPVEWLNVQA
ncbi:hypothetical protein BDF14DRAFT_1773232 [Spinellus fusiger]|nr:hypothetical protein BDF14DRAFT_1773232 [Spinellus fusiger]